MISTLYKKYYFSKNYIFELIYFQGVLIEVNEDIILNSKMKRKKKYSSYSNLFLLQYINKLACF